MNWTVYLTECVVSVALFTAAILIPLRRNPVWWIHDYPEDIQEKVTIQHPSHSTLSPQAPNESLQKDSHPVSWQCRYKT